MTAPDNENFPVGRVDRQSLLTVAGALFTGQISRWACHWLTVTVRAEWERIWIDDQEIIDFATSRASFTGNVVMTGARSG